MNIQSLLKTALLAATNPHLAASQLAVQAVRMAIASNKDTKEELDFNKEEMRGLIPDSEVQKLVDEYPEETGILSEYFDEID